MLIEHLMLPIFEEWLEIQLLNRNVNLPISKLEKFNKPVFVAKRQKYVDPVKELTAQKIALEIGVTSRQRIAAEMGLDFIEILSEREQEESLMKQLGISTNIIGASTTVPPNDADTPNASNPDLSIPVETPNANEDGDIE